MRNFRLTIFRYYCLTIMAAAAVRVQSDLIAQQPILPPSVTATSAPSPSSSLGGQTEQPSPLMQMAQRIRPAVILVTVFDSTGKLLRSGTGFFVSESGRIVTALRTLDGAVNAVAKTADNGIYNIVGVIASSTKLDLAVLSAEVKKVPFVSVNKEAKPQAGTSAAVVDSALAGSGGKPVEGTIVTNDDENQFEVSARVLPVSFGAPVVDANGDLIGVVIGRDEKNENAVLVRPASVISSLLGEARSSSSARWPGQPQPSSTPALRLVSTPSPRYPLEARFHDSFARSGRYRLNFEANGTVKSVQVLRSTGSEILDRAAVNGLQQWRAESGREGFVIVPLTFQSR
jgi:putative serine protease PepD